MKIEKKWLFTNAGKNVCAFILDSFFFFFFNVVNTDRKLFFFENSMLCE